MRRARGWLALVLVVFSLSPGSMVQAGGANQDVDARQKAGELLAQLTPEEKVGQLFLVTFTGSEVVEGSQISDLITRHAIGGVVLTAENDNFTDPANTPAQAHTLISTLQELAWNSASSGGQSAAAETPAPSNYIPLFVGLSQEGDSYPNDQILNGLTSLPDLMAVGATWNPDLSRQVGAVLGSELKTMGFNLLLGPSLDVLDVLPTEGGEDMGTRTFGGDPYWVGILGQSYIQGLHEGAGGKLAVVAKHFPGRGGSDRRSDEEVATVRKSLEQLKQIELAPFFTVTGNAAASEAATDGLLVSHIRYQGFQGNVRAATRPVSFDSAALDLILQLPEFVNWRANGGVLVSDDLGSVALRRFYETTGQAFDARQVARNAFLSGNDLLYVNNFVAEGDPDSYTTTLRTLSLFAQKYREDPAFAERVDSSVMRILTLKFRMYPQFLLDEVIPLTEEVSALGKSQQVVFEVARQGATLISPEVEELEVVLPRPPGLNDRIVFITDVRPEKQCSRCYETSTLPVDAFQNAVVRLYGPQASGQIAASRLSSYSFKDLTAWLDGTSDVPNLEQDLRQASWIVFGTLNVDSGLPETRVLKRFLSEQAELFRNKRVIAFSFGAPYYLDSTDISKLTAYYAMYSKIPAFVEMAARILFQEVMPGGALPVSVPGVGYDLITAMSPDPNQVIPLVLDTVETQPEAAGTAEPEPTPVPVFKAGDTMPLRAGVIYDHNGNPVPDGTVVRFLFMVGGETGTVQQVETVTKDGVARAAYRIQSPGLLEISVVSDPATTSDLLRLNVSETGGVITPIAPTIEPTLTPTATVTPSPTVTPTATQVVLPPSKPAATDWMATMLLIWGAAAVVFLASRELISLQWGLRMGLTAAVGGLLVYLYFALVRLANEDNARDVSTSRILILVFLGTLAGCGLGWLWKKFIERRARSQPDRHITGPKSPVR